MSVVQHEGARLGAYRGRRLFWEGMMRKDGSLGHRLYHHSYALQGNTGPKGWVHPKKVDDHPIRCGTTPGYAVQLAVMLGMSPIGLLGVDFNAAALRSTRVPSHCYGEGNPEGATGGGLFTDEPNTLFWTSVPSWARDLGVEVVNLSPFDDSPFSRGSGWARESLQDFAGRAREVEDEWRTHRHDGPRSGSGAEDPGGCQGVLDGEGPCVSDGPPASRERAPREAAAKILHDPVRPPRRDDPVREQSGGESVPATPTFNPLGREAGRGKLPIGSRQLLTRLRE